MLILLSLVATLVATAFILRAFVTASPATLVRHARLGAGGLALAGAAVFAMRGGLVIALPLAAFGLKALFGQQAPFWHRRGGSVSETAPRVTSIETETLRMELDLDSGAMCGMIIRGRHAGHAIETLTPADVAQVWRECSFADPKSARLIEAYLDRSHPLWREDMAEAERRDDATATQHMTRDLALQVLGLSGDAGESEIRTAHRDLMKKLHPDHGGSAYLAAQINQARDVLLAK